MNVAALCVGAVLMLAFPLMAWHALGYRSWRRVQGKVVGFKEDPDPSDDEPLKAPVIQFLAEDGSVHEVAGAVFTRSTLKVGSKVEVIHPASDPGRARLARQRFVLHWLVGGMGLVVFAVGLFSAD